MCILTCSLDDRTAPETDPASSPHAASTAASSNERTSFSVGVPSRASCGVNMQAKDVERSTPTQQPTIPWSSLLRQRPWQCSTLQLTQQARFYVGKERTCQPKIVLFSHADSTPASSNERTSFSVGVPSKASCNIDMQGVYTLERGGRGFYS